MLDLEIFIMNNQLHTKENRKETASNLYLRFGSAHPQYTFKGIVKSQVYRLRRLCSRNEDYKTAIDGLRKRCINSGYDKKMVEETLRPAGNLKRELHSKIHTKVEANCKIRWVTLSNSIFEKDITTFVKKMNHLLKEHHVQFEIIKTTSPNIGSLLFNNFEKPKVNQKCLTTSTICDNDAQRDDKVVVSSINKQTYNINQHINCLNSGIYAITCKCTDQYFGKTTITHSGRYTQHWTTNTTVNGHLNTCKSKPTLSDVKVQFLENVWDRGKYSLSEREYLWNKRLKGTINIQKTIKASN